MDLYDLYVHIRIWCNHLQMAMKCITLNKFLIFLLQKVVSACKLSWGGWQDAGEFPLLACPRSSVWHSYTVASKVVIAVQRHQRVTFCWSYLCTLRVRRKWHQWWFQHYTTHMGLVCCNYPADCYAIYSFYFVGFKLICCCSVPATLETLQGALICINYYS